MKNAKLIREFGYVQAQMAQAEQGIFRTKHGARLGHVRKYIALFKEYTSLRKKVRAEGYGLLHKYDKINTLDRNYVFGQLIKLEDTAWKPLAIKMDNK